MVNLVIRKDGGGFRDYFDGDFNAVHWEGIPTCMMGLVLPQILQQEREVDGWKPLDRSKFNDLSSRFSSKVIGYEFGFAPPKSFSIGALCGGEVSMDLLNVHRLAVTIVLSRLPELFFVRRTSGQSKWLEPAKRNMIRFRHPYNRANEPQLHEHVFIFAKSADAGSLTLDGRPFFEHQHAIMVLYHYELVRLLGSLGYRVERGGRSVLDWEIAGIDKTLIPIFSSRSRRSDDQWVDDFTARRAVTKKRLAVLTERRQWPKTESILLSDAREKWRKTIGDRCVIPVRCSPRYGASVGEMGLANLFRFDGVQTRLELESRWVAEHFDSDVPLPEISVALDDSLCTAEKAEEVRFHLGCVFGHIPTIKTEGLIHDVITSGRGYGSDFEGDLSSFTDLPPLRSALARSDAVRLAAVPRDRISDTAAMVRVASPALTVVPVEDWSSGSLQKAMSGLDGKSIVIIGPQEWGERSRFHDVLRQQIKIEPQSKKVLKSGKTKIRFGKLPSEPPARFFQKLLESRSHCVILAPEDLVEEERRSLNQKILGMMVKRGQIGYACTVDVVQPWPDPSTTIDMDDLWVVALHNTPLLRHGTRWRIHLLDSRFVNLEKDTGYHKRVLWEDLVRSAGRLICVREEAVKLPQGRPCRARCSFRVGGLSVKAGHWLTPRFVEPDGSIGVDGGILKPGFRLFEPDLLVREIPTGKIESLVVWYEGGDVAPLLALRAEREILIVSDLPDLMRAGCREMLTSAASKRKKGQKNKSWVGHRLIPEPEFWLQEMLLSRDLDRVKSDPVDVSPVQQPPTTWKHLDQTASSMTSPKRRRRLEKVKVSSPPKDEGGPTRD